GRPNVELVTSGIREVREHAIVTGDGTEIPVDTIVFGTGFHVTDVPMAPRVRGRAGRTLDDVWEGSAQAFRGTTVSGFPNFFILLGPNTGLGHNSVVYMAESQLNYVMDALRVMRERGVESVDVRPEAQEGYNAKVQRVMGRTVWNTGGCSSWYIDRNGRNTTIWPDFTWRYRLKTRRFDASAYAAAAWRAAARSASTLQVRYPAIGSAPSRPACSAPRASAGRATSRTYSGVNSGWPTSPSPTRPAASIIRGLTPAR